MTGSHAGYAKFARGIDNAIHALGNAYGRAITQALKIPLRDDRVFSFWRWPPLGTCIIHVPTGFVPQEDQNYFIVVVQAPQGASLAYTTDIASRLRRFCALIPMFLAPSLFLDSL